MATEGDLQPPEKAESKPEREAQRPRREHLALGLSAASIVIALAGTGVALYEANAARDQADAAKEQADVARDALNQEVTAQSRRVNVNGDDYRGTLTVENTSTLPVRDVRLYLGDSEEPVVEYDAYAEIPGCKAITWRIEDTLPSDLMVGFADATGKQWLADMYDGLEPATIDAFELPEDWRSWPTRVRSVATCA